MTNQALQEMIPQVWKDGYEELLKNELVITDGANQSFGQNVSKFGDAVIIEIEPNVTGSAWTGGDLTAPVQVAGSTAEGKVNKGYQYNFKIKNTDSLQARPTLQGAKNLIKTAMFNFAEAIEIEAAALYTEAGIVATDSVGDPILIDQDTAWEALAYMNNLFDKAKLPKKGRVAYLDSNFCTFLNIQGKNSNTEDSRQTEWKNGRTGKVLSGFEIRMSNNIYNDGAEDPTYQPLFGMDKQYMGLAMQKDLELKYYMPEASLDDAWKGGAVYGLFVYRNDKFGTMKTKYGSFLA